MAIIDVSGPFPAWGASFSCCGRGGEGREKIGFCTAGIGSGVLGKQCFLYGGAGKEAEIKRLQI
jgi:hypothetical protein